MQLPTHLAVSWLIGARLPERRDRVLVAWAGVLPDLDALSLIAGRESYLRWHHVLTHTAWAALATAVLLAVVARARRKTVLLGAVAFHVHLALDLLSGGDGWTVPYLYPLSAFEIESPIQWPLRSWQNLVAAVAALAVTGWVGVTRGRTFVEAVLPKRADDAVVATLRRWTKRAA